MADRFHEQIEAARREPAYGCYLRVRDWVLRLLSERSGPDASGYWAEELAGFDYMLDASPLIIRKLREHCYHLTGLRSYEYRGHHRHRAPAFADKLRSLAALDRRGLFIPEPADLGGFGHRIDGRLVNVDTLKFYECLIALDRVGILPSLEEGGGAGKTVLEIGAGWGGLAHQLRVRCPRIAYFIIDLPSTLLFSATYLGTLFPGASILLPERPEDLEPDRLRNRDFVFIPHFWADRLRGPRPDLVINTVSFQEMTELQVAAYVDLAASLGCPVIFSLNRDHSPHNAELSSIIPHLDRRYELEEVPMLEVAYPIVRETKPRTHGRPVLEVRSEDYRHIVGRLRPGNPEGPGFPHPNRRGGLSGS